MKNKGRIRIKTDSYKNNAVKRKIENIYKKWKSIVFLE
jgi:hypothetical protein